MVYYIIHFTIPVLFESVLRQVSIRSTSEALKVIVQLIFKRANSASSD